MAEFDLWVVIFYVFVYLSWVLDLAEQKKMHLGQIQFDLVLDKKPINGINLYLLEQPPPGEHSTCSYWHELRTEKGKVGPLKKKQTNPAISQDWEVETGQWLLWSDCKPGGMINWVVGIQGLGS